jgi:hypothetical protein
VPPAYCAQRAMSHPSAVHDAETGALVGFAMISDNIPQPIDDDLVGPYYLWRFYNWRATALLIWRFLAD